MLGALEPRLSSLTVSLHAMENLVVLHIGIEEPLYIMVAIFWRKRYFFSLEETIDNTMIMEELAGEIRIQVNYLRYQNH